jgi:hypothetical protein
MSTRQQTDDTYCTAAPTPVEALGRALETLFPDSPPVYDVVDPDALNALFAARTDGTPRVDGTVTFTYRDHEFVVASNGDVRVAER